MQHWNYSVAAWSSRKAKRSGANNLQHFNHATEFSIYNLIDSLMYSNNNGTSMSVTLNMTTMLTYWIIINTARTHKGRNTSMNLKLTQLFANTNASNTLIPLIIINTIIIIYVTDIKTT